MKVVHVEAGRYLYGGALQVLFLLNGLRERGVDSLLVCPPRAAIAGAAREAGFAVREVPLAGDADLRFIPRLRRVLREERPDILHLHSRRGADVLGGIAGRLAGVPIVLSRRVDNPEPRWLVAVKYRLFDRVITISRGIRRVLLAEGVPEEKVVCVPSAVDTDLYTPANRDDAWFRAEFGLEPDERTVGMVAQFIPRKGHRTLIDAMPAVLREQPRTRFLLFGRGPLETEIRDRVQQQGLANRVILAGFRDDLHRVMPNLGVLAHPAEMEGLGVALLQAAACEVPIVACPVGGIPEIVRPGETGELVEPGDTRGLAAALSGMLSNECGRRARGARAREHVMEHFSVAVMVNGNEAVYRSLAACGKGRWR